MTKERLQSLWDLCRRHDQEYIDKSGWSRCCILLHFTAKETCKIFAQISSCWTFRTKTKLHLQGSTSSCVRERLRCYPEFVAPPDVVTKWNFRLLFFLVFVWITPVFLYHLSWYLSKIPLVSWNLLEIIQHINFYHGRKK